MPGSERKAAGLRRRWSTQSSPRRQWRRRRAAEEREEKGGSELGASATTGLTEYWEAGTEEAFAREGGTSRGRRQLPGHGGSRERRRSRRRRPTMLGVDAGETEENWRRGRQGTGKEGAGGSASAASRRKQRRMKRPGSMAATTSWEGGTGGLMKTETRPTATEGREDQHVVGDGKEEEGERDSGGDEVCRGYGSSITEEKGGGVCGGGREGRKGDGRRWRKREEREKRQGGRRWKRGRGGRRCRG